jgi:hypothetical protein
MSPDAVPEWVHMVDVPPPTDEEPWTAYYPEDPPTRWGWAVVLAVFALAAAAAVWSLR